MKYVYIVKSGSLHPTKQEYWLSNSYFTSLKVANLEHDQILKINKAEGIEDEFVFDTIGEIKRTKYVGEGGKYKALIVIEKKELKS